MPTCADLKTRYDVVVVGGGIHGAAAAMEATRLGHDVLLVEKNDFCSGTSANSLKIIHGGLRYLRSANLARSRESAREQRALARLAPHLLIPLPCLMGTDHSLSGGRLALSLGIRFYDHVICAGLGRRPRGRVLSADEANELAGFDAFPDCAGAALWHDYQVIDSERLVMAYIKTAENAGAHVRNYAEVTAVDSGRALAVSIRDAGSRTTCRVEAGRIIDTASVLKPHPAWARAVNLVVSRQLGTHAIGRKLARASEDAGRLFFATPFGERMIVGTWYFPDRTGCPGKLLRHEYQRCLADVRDLLPGMKIQETDVSLVHLGRLPVADPDEPLSLLEKPVIQALDDDKRVVSVTGVKYTTARPTALKALRLAGLDAGRGTRPLEALYGTARSGSALEEEVGNRLGAGVVSERRRVIARRLCRQYGAAAVDIAGLAATSNRGAERVPGQEAIHAEIQYCIEAEHCRTVADFLLRRSGIGSLGPPPDSTTRYCAAAMGTLLDWSDRRVEAEVEALQSFYNRVEG